MVEANADSGFAQFSNIGEAPEKVLNDEVKEYEADLEDEFFIIKSGDY